MQLVVDSWNPLVYIMGDENEKSNGKNEMKKLISNATLGTLAAVVTMVVAAFIFETMGCRPEFTNVVGSILGVIAFGTVAGR